MLVLSGVEGGLGAGVSMPSGAVDMPSGSVDMPSGSVDTPSASLDIPSSSVDAPSASVDMPSVSGAVDAPSVDLTGKAPEMPSVDAHLSGEVPAASVDVVGSVPSGEVDVSMPSVSATAEGVTEAVGDLSADVGAKIDDVDVKVPVMPSASGEWKKPKKSMFGSIFGSGKGKMEVSGKC